MKNRKRMIIKAVACILTCCMILPFCLSGCSNNGKTLMSLDKHKFSVNFYQLMLSQQKGAMAYEINSIYGNYNSEKFWGMTIDKETQKTNADYYEELVLERGKDYLAALALFDELERTKTDFEFPKVYEQNIDAAIESMKQDTGGTKNSLNTVLSEYGINHKMLKNFLIMDAKFYYVMDYLYGADGSKIGDAVKEEYYNENYVSCKEIIIQKYSYVYRTDEDGNEIYFDPQTQKPIYDKTQNLKYNKDGTVVVDKEGTRMYFDKDGEIAYDKLTGVRIPVTDGATGAVVTQQYSEEKINSLREKAKALVADADGKGINYFETLRMKNSESYSSSDKTEGNIFLDVNMTYSAYSSKIFDYMADSLEKMQVGDVKLIEDEVCFAIIIKTELESGAWGNEKYEEAFTVLNDFTNGLIYELYDAKLAPYKERIEIDHKVLDSLNFSIRTVSPNYYYPDPNVAYYLYESE